MGEYAIDQMMRDYKAETGQDAERKWFEDQPKKRPKNAHFCPQCRRKFKSEQTLAQHNRDKHSPMAKEE